MRKQEARAARPAPPPTGLEQEARCQGRDGRKPLLLRGQGALVEFSRLRLADVRPRELRRPLSKTVRFNVLKVIPAGSKAGKSFDKF